MAKSKAKSSPKKSSKKVKVTSKKAISTSKKVKATSKRVRPTLKSGKITAKKVKATSKKVESTLKHSKTTFKKAKVTSKKVKAAPREVKAILKKEKPAKLPVYKKVKSILISQPQPEIERNPYSELAEKFKIKIDFRQFILIEGIPGKDFRKFKITPTDYSAVVLNSKNAVDHFFRICDEMRTRMSHETKYFCVSEAVALYLQKYILYRKRKVFYGNGRENELVELMLKHKDTERFLLPCSDMHKEGLSEIMESEGIDFDKATIYRTISSDLSDMKKKFNYDIIVFFSPSGLKSLYDNFPKFKQGTTRIAAFGKTTAKAVQEHGLTLDIEAPLPELPSMASALDNYLSLSNRK